MLHITGFWRKGMWSHRHETSLVCKISHVLIALKWWVVVASSVSFYDDFNVYCLLLLLTFIIKSHQKLLLPIGYWAIEVGIHEDIAFKLVFQRSHATTCLDSFRYVIARIPIIIFPGKPIVEEIFIQNRTHQLFATWIALYNQCHNIFTEKHLNLFYNIYQSHLKNPKTSWQQINEDSLQYSRQTSVNS